MRYQDDIRAVATLNLPWEQLDGCNILVAGATGLIGSCMVDILMAHPNRTYSVFALGRNDKRLIQSFKCYEKEKEFHILKWDITNPLSCSTSFHFIIHAASGANPAEFANHPVEVMKANLIGLMNLFDYGIKHDMKRLLYISSGEVYGEGDGRVFSEDYSGYVNTMLPRSCYPSSKRAAESLCASYYSEFNTDVVIARPCHVYGPHYSDNDKHVYAQFIQNILDDNDVVLKSTGEQIRSWCYVVDCVSALLHVLFKGEPCQAYNIADSSSTISIRDLAELVARIGGKRVIVKLPSDREKAGYNLVTKSVFSTTKIEALGWNVSGNIFDKMSSTIQERIAYEHERVNFR